ncbi:unnamed protein product [Urochloa humidicola]
MEDDAPSAALPVDLVLEIVARSDPATLIRCAATSKALRLGAASPAFHCGLRLRHAAGEGARFLPALLRGFFHQRRRRAEGEDPRFVDPRLPRGAPSPEPFRSFLSEYTDLFEFYAPAAARGGLVALRSSSPDDEEEPRARCSSMGVCEPMAGLLEFFRPPGISAQSHVLLTDGCDGIGCHFRLLAANLHSPPADDRAACCCLQTQAYSSDAGAWGPITETWVLGLPERRRRVRASGRSRPRRRCPLAMPPHVVGSSELLHLNFQQQGIDSNCHRYPSRRRRRRRWPSPAPTRLQAGRAAPGVVSGGPSD